MRRIYFSEAFHGVALFLRRPLSALVWTVGASALIGAIHAASVGSAKVPVEENLIVLVIEFILAVVTSTAVMRAVLRPGQGGLWFMKLGADELLQVAVQIATAAATFAALIVIGIVVVGLSASLTDGRLPEEPSAFGAAAVGVSAMLVVVAVLSLIAPMSFDRKALMFGEGASMALRRFWGLLPVFLVMLAAIVGAPFVLERWPWSVAVPDDLIAPAADYLDPGMVQAFAEAFMTTLPTFVATVVSFGAAAAAYRSIKADEGALARSTYGTVDEPEPTAS